MKDFLKSLENVSYRHGIVTVFDDLLTVSVCAFANQSMEVRYLETIKKYDKKELDKLVKCFAQMIVSYENGSDNKGTWCDLLGDMYMELASRSKQSGLGQFFTPVTVCRFMAEILSSDEPEFKLRVSDPCSGSGRTIVAHSRVKPINIGTYYYAADLDRMCVMMTIINMVLYGMQGEVVHMNSLSMEVYGGYLVHSPYTGLGVQQMSDSQLDPYRYHGSKMEPEPFIINPKFKANPLQISLF